MKRIALLGFVVVASQGYAAPSARLEDFSTRETIRHAQPTQPIFTNQVVVRLAPNSNPTEFAMANGLQYQSTFESNPDFHVFAAPSVRYASALASEYARRGHQNEVFQVRASKVVRCAFTPNDPYYPWSGSYGQWHLNNTMTAGLDVNIIPAWNRDLTGLGVTIGVVDDGMEYTHPDLSANYSATHSYDFFGGDADPAPGTGDFHGTSVSGVAAARGGNGIGVTGAAPNASVSCQRIGFTDTFTDAQLADAVMFHSALPNHFIEVKNHSYGYTEPFVPDPLGVAATELSMAAKTIHCYAAGNWRGSWAQDANKQDLLTSSDVVTVAALGSTGSFSSYSSFGANVTCTAPSSASGGLGITTTDRTGSLGYNGMADQNYTNGFGGTSSATPLVVGIMALVKQVNPNADSRFAKHLLARTCKIVNSGDSTLSSDGGWRTNAAGYHFNQNYGFGLIDADAITQQAATYAGTTPRVTFDSGVIDVSTAIPDNGAAVSRSYTVTGSGKVEDVRVKARITHPFRGDIQIKVTSPSGYTSRMSYRSTSDNGSLIDWTFLSNAFWGESATGTWRVDVYDTTAGNVGTWNDFRLLVNTGDVVGSKTISGKVTLQEFLGTVLKRPITVELWNTAGTQLQQWVSTTLDASGNYTATMPAANGDYLVKIKASHWLKSNAGTVDLNSSSSASNVNASLRNGDCDGDNVVSIFDYVMLSNAFDTAVALSSPNEGADLDGDKFITIFDYLIMSSHFDQFGS
ncbi:MAG: S8 family serine peptidase [Armatimonadetes bacterium]|nr:S8 family serine peptidase [Armatimonadota bacterium]